MSDNRTDLLRSEFKEAKETGDDNRLAYTLDNYYRQIIEQNDLIVEFVQGYAEKKTEHPIFDSLYEFHLWCKEEDFENGAIPAIHSLQSAADQVEKDGWRSTQFVLLIQKAWLKSDLAGHDPTDSYMECLNMVCREEELLSHPMSVSFSEEIPGNHILTLFDDIAEYYKQIDSSTLTYALKISALGADRFRRKNHGYAERNWLDRAIQLSNSVNRDLDELSYQLQKLESYEVEVVNQRKYNMKAAKLHRAINECQDILNREDQMRLSGRIQAYENKSISKGEYTEFKETIDRDAVEPALDFFDENFSKIVDRLSVQAALWSSTLWDGFLPNDSVFLDQTPSIKDIVSKRVVDHEGNPISISPGGLENTGGSIPQEYKFQLQIYDQILQSCLLRSIDEYDIEREDFYGLIESIPGLSNDDIGFLKSAIDCYFAGDYAASFHLSMSRLEGVIKRALKSRGQVTNAPKPDKSIEQRSLSGLVDLIEEEDHRLANYLHSKYVDKEGQNLRNRTAHSQVFYAEMNAPLAILTLYDVLRSGIRIKHHFE